MGAPVVLVAYASETGSTARIAEAIATELRAEELTVACRLAAEVDNLDPFGALILGSGVYVRSRHSDGGGFLTRHARDIEGKPVWLFCSGPIGRGRGDAAVASTDSACIDVAHAIGARGAQAFGCLGVDPLDSELAEPVDMGRVRAWAHEIAADLRAGRLQTVTA